MSSNMKFVTMTLCLAVCSSVHSQTAPPPATSKPLSTSLGLVVFPAKGQTPQKQSQDEGECYAWSKGQTGVDPMAPAPAAAPAPAQEAAAPPPGGQRAKGAVRGAAAGAVIGEVADDDAGKGAAIGATVGVVKGGAEKRRAQEQAQQDAAKKQEATVQQQTAATQEQLNLFKKGFAACLEPKGYTVK
jgi:YmgG-like glycine-zipper protein